MPLTSGLNTLSSSSSQCEKYTDVPILGTKRTPSLVPPHASSMPTIEVSVESMSGKTVSPPEHVSAAGRARRGRRKEEM